MTRPPVSVDEQAAVVEALVETITESVKYALWSHETRRESRYGENVAWDVDVPESCSLCAFETALAALAARACEAVSLREALRDVLDVAERIRGGDSSLDPEEWYARRDYARAVLARAALPGGLEA